MQIYFTCCFFILGAIFGSFYNVVILRLPNHESIVHGSSHCPKCLTVIKPYDLIPIISYLFLNGKCRHCHQPIAIRYPLIEFLTGSLFALTFWNYGFTIQTLIGLILNSLLIIIAMIDIDTMEIYDRFQIMLGCLAIISLFISPLPFTDHLIGFFIISGPFLLIAYLTNGIGGGDIKLIAVCGFLLGYQATIVAFFFASVIGGIIAVLLLATKQKDRKSQIAFGPYLCIGVALAYLYGLPIMNWYLSLMF